MFLTKVFQIIQLRTFDPKMVLVIVDSWKVSFTLKTFDSCWRQSEGYRSIPNSKLNPESRQLYALNFAFSSECKISLIKNLTPPVGKPRTASPHANQSVLRPWYRNETMHSSVYRNTEIWNKGKLCACLCCLLNDELNENLAFSEQNNRRPNQKLWA